MNRYSCHADGKKVICQDTAAQCHKSGWQIVGSEEYAKRKARELNKNQEKAEKFYNYCRS